MELICPACEARYQLPPGAVPEEGRQVSCQNCGHSWLAMPEIALGEASVAPAAAPTAAPAAAPAAPPAHTPSPPTGITWGGPGGMPASVAAAMAPAPEPVPEHLLNEPDEAAGEIDETPKSSEPRAQQLAEIRQMLEEMQSDDRGSAPSSHAAQAQFEGAMDLTEEPEPRRLGEIDEDELGFTTRLTRLAGATEPAKPVDVKRIRKKHDRRISKKKHAEKAGSGFFLTGLLLIVIMAAVFASLYVLHPQIIAQVPESEAAMLEYVAAVDEMRRGFDQTFSGTIEWVNTRLQENTE